MPDKATLYGTVDVYRDDVDSCKPQGWIRTNVIAAAFASLQRSAELSKGSVLLVDPSVAQCIAQFNDVSVGPIEEMAAARHLIFALNDFESATHIGAGQHWSLLLLTKLDVEGDILFIPMHFDSSGDCNRRHALSFVRTLQAGSGYLAPGRNAVWSPLRTCTTFPQQQNSYDCGAYVILGAERLVQLADASAVVDPTESDWLFDEDTAARVRREWFSKLETALDSGIS
jgi:hypothetical protein